VGRAGGSGGGAGTTPCGGQVSGRRAGRSAASARGSGWTGRRAASPTSTSPEGAEQGGATLRS
jgi:hypothetical protein